MFCLEVEDLYEIDALLAVDDPDRLDDEIEHIVVNLWRDIGCVEEFLAPFFTTFLQSNLLRPLYIYYFSLAQLQKEHSNIIIKASNSLLDIAATSLGVELCVNRSMHDDAFYLSRNYLFTKIPQGFLGGNRLLRILVWNLIEFIRPFRKIDILYLNAGKLEKDFSYLKRKCSISIIPPKKSKRLSWQVDLISTQVLRNITELQLSIPTDCVVRLIKLRVLAYLEDVFDRIGVLVETIENHQVKLVIATAPTHEDHLCLLAAAKVVGIKSLVTSHGMTFVKNAFLENYFSAQATLNMIEHKYAGVKSFQMRYLWFDRKI